MQTYCREAVKLCASLLVEKNLSLAFVENATSGRATLEFSLIDIERKFLKGGIVFLDAKVTETLLKVNPEVLELHSCESMEVAREAVNGLSFLIDADLRIGITGVITARNGAKDEIPPGTIYVYCTLGNAMLFEESYFFSGSAEDIIFETIAQISIDIYIHLMALDVTD